MAKFRVGQKIKKVRGVNAGATGTVVSLEPRFHSLGNDREVIEITTDTGFVDTNPGSHHRGTWFPPGVDGVTYADEWEPLTKGDQHALEEEVVEELSHG